MAPMDIGDITREMRGQRLSLTGILRSSAPVKGPISETELAGCDVICTYLDSDAKQHRIGNWVPCWLEDDTGIVLLKPEIGRVRAPVTGDVVLEGAAKIQRMLAHVNATVRDPRADLHVIERGIPEGVRVHVQATLYSDDRQGFRTSAEQSLALVGLRGSPIVIVPS